MMVALSLGPLFLLSLSLIILLLFWSLDTSQLTKEKIWHVLERCLSKPNIFSHSVPLKTHRAVQKMNKYHILQTTILPNSLQLDNKQTPVHEQIPFQLFWFLHTWKLMWQSLAIQDDKNSKACVKVWLKFAPSTCKHFSLPTFCGNSFVVRSFAPVTCLQMQPEKRKLIFNLSVVVGWVWLQKSQKKKQHLLVTEWGDWDDSQIQTSAVNSKTEWLKISPHWRKWQWHQLTHEKTFVLISKTNKKSSQEMSVSRPEILIYTRVSIHSTFQILKATLNKTRKCWEKRTKDNLWQTNYL